MASVDNKALASFRLDLLFLQSQEDLELKSHHPLTSVILPTGPFSDTNDGVWLVHSEPL